jgi:hypothetical protein
MLAGAASSTAAARDAMAAVVLVGLWVAFA